MGKVLKLDSGNHKPLILTKLQGRRREQTPQQRRQGRGPSPRSPPPHPQTLRSHKQKRVHKSH